MAVILKVTGGPESSRPMDRYIKIASENRVLLEVVSAAPELEMKFFGPEDRVHTVAMALRISEPNLVIYTPERFED